MTAKDLADRVYIVTGASRGIGKQIALDLARAGAQVVVAARSTRSRERLPGSIGETVAGIEAAGGRARAVPLDVRDAAAVEAVVRQSAGDLGRLDGVIHNAGALWWKPALETPVKRFDLVMQVNVRAAFALATSAAREMIRLQGGRAGAAALPAGSDQGSGGGGNQRGGGGHVLFLSPPLDLRSHPGMAAYTVSKFGMTQLALSLADEWREHRIAVNALWPATLVESQATINWQLGRRSQWRKAKIVADAALALLRRDPASATGGVHIDEDVLREEGVTDFSPYRCDPDVEPEHLDYARLADILSRGPSAT